MEGLMAPSEVVTVIEALAANTTVPLQDRRKWIAELPKLCQLRAEPSVLQSAGSALERIGYAAPDDALARARAAVNEPISPSQDKATASLHHDWVEETAVTIHTRGDGKRDG